MNVCYYTMVGYDSPYGSVASASSIWIHASVTYDSLIPYNPLVKLQLGMWWLQDEEPGFLIVDVAEELVMS
ncbi:hypothetical protein GUJ93_ZPchr0015g6783 [Zizania palustris]|uniref:Uncharacterized protein n=1 Tax=Zizania palustris TaxID=103762 RepID=A0A8J5TI69_ZIZPA|nr:hypothetical protein GUJ93_ZPchr0015g6783 [Zizania palustris]